MWATWCKAECEHNIIGDKVFFEDSFFSGFTLTKAININFDILKYQSVMNLNSFDQSNYKHFPTYFYWFFLTSTSCSRG